MKNRCLIIFYMILICQNISASDLIQNYINDTKVTLKDRMKIQFSENHSLSFQSVEALRFKNITISMKKITLFLRNPEQNDRAEYDRALAYFTATGAEAETLFLKVIEAIHIQIEFIKNAFRNNNHLKQAILQRNRNETIITGAIINAVEKFNEILMISEISRNKVQDYYRKDLLYINDIEQSQENQEENALLMSNNAKQKKLFLSPHFGFSLAMNFGLQLSYYPESSDNSVSGFIFNLYMQKYNSANQLFICSSLLYSYKYYSISPLHNLHLAFGIDFGIKLKGETYYPSLYIKDEYNKYFGGISFEFGYLFISKNQKYTLSFDIFIKMHTRIFNKYEGIIFVENSPFISICDIGFRLSIGFNLF